MLDTSSVGIPICCGRLNDFLTCSKRYMWGLGGQRKYYGPTEVCVTAATLGSGLSRTFLSVLLLVGFPPVIGAKTRHTHPSDHHGASSKEDWV